VGNGAAQVTIKTTDLAFKAAWTETGGRAAIVGKLLGLSERAVYMRRNAIEAREGVHLPSAGDGNGKGRGDAGGPANDYLQRVSIDGFTGTVVVFSDAHYYPGIGATVAHRALVEVVKDLKPKLIVANGDIFEGARLSRFPRNGWEQQPRVADELDEVRDRMAEIRHAYRGARLTRTVGNHCIRLDRFLATHASDFEGVGGFRLSDHLPQWQECMSVFVNGSCMIKHRITGGIHSAYRNTVMAGTSTVTGHTHLLEVKPYGDYRGRRYGVSTGALADIDSPAFSYTEDSPVAWCSGFAVLTFDKDGRLLMPELAEVIDGRCYFRGQVVIDGRKKIRAAA
jgi:hypothetical protein